jgi:hypothetical protein
VVLQKESLSINLSFSLEVENLLIYRNKMEDNFQVKVFTTKKFIDFDQTEYEKLANPFPKEIVEVLRFKFPLKDFFKEKYCSYQNLRRITYTKKGSIVHPKFKEYVSKQPHLQ